jgi:hypothetical protein
MELSKEAFQLWRRLPETKAFQRYLMDKRSELMDDWAKGLISPDASAEHVVEAMTYKTIAETDFEEIEFFYQK